MTLHLGGKVKDSFSRSEGFPSVQKGFTLHERCRAIIPNASIATDLRSSKIRVYRSATNVAAPKMKERLATSVPPGFLGHLDDVAKSGLISSPCHLRAYSRLPRLLLPLL